MHNVGAAMSAQDLAGSGHSVADPTAAMRRRVVFASTLGNAFEWFDYGIFGMFAPIISKLFFPAGSELTSMLLTFATFAVAFAMRPLSGVLFGLYADRLGRKRALTLMIIMMAVGTGMIGLLPTYAAIGVAAPLLMVVARLIQGISVGGEFANATAMLVEYSPANRRGYYGSFQMVSQALGFTGGALLAYLATTYVAPASLESWGWRLPFLLGILIGPFGYWLRSNIDETPEFQRYLQSAQKPANTPLVELFTQYPRELVVGFCIVVMGTVSFYVMLLYIPIYAVRQLGLPMSGVQLSSVLSTVLIVIFCPFAGSLSDRIGRRKILLPAAIIYAVLVWVAVHQLLAEPSLTRLIIAQMATSLVMAFLWGPTPVMLMDLLPVGVRSTGVGLIYNVAVALFGGLAPFIVTWLIAATGDKASPAYYVAFSALVGVSGLLLMRERPR
jgi:MHS family proline/betaine transporter-like MFS transporter